MVKFINGSRLIAGWLAVLGAIFGPWLMDVINPGFGVGVGIFSVIACDLYFEIKWMTNRWGDLKAFGISAGLAVIELVYFILVAAIGHY